jgi:hypothetical protein
MSMIGIVGMRYGIFRVIHWRVQGTGLDTIRAGSRKESALRHDASDPARRDPDPPAWIMNRQPRLRHLLKKIMAGLLQRPGSGPVRIRNDLDALPFSHFEAQEVGQ